MVDGLRRRPARALAYKRSAPDPEPDGWLRVGDSVFGPTGVHGGAGPATWALDWTGDEPGLRHLPKSIMYSAPLPKTKLESRARTSGSPAGSR